MTLYETEEDRARERAVLQVYQHKRMIPLLRVMKPTEGYDGEVYWPDGRIYQLIEVKTRNIPADKYEHYIIDKIKVDNGIERAAQVGADFILLVQWEANDVRYLNLSSRRRIRRKDMISVVRRRDREGEKADDVYLLPIKDFLRIT